MYKYLINNLLINFTFNVAISLPVSKSQILAVWSIEPQYLFFIYLWLIKVLKDQITNIQFQIGDQIMFSLIIHYSHPKSYIKIENFSSFIKRACCY